MANAQGAWTQKANFSNLEGAVGFSIGTKGYVGTGWDSNGDWTNIFWEWNQATNVWTQKAPLPGVGRKWATGFSIGTKGYIGTGEDMGQNDLKDFWEWDQSSNTWMQKADFGGTPLKGASAFSIGAKGYIIASTSSNNFWEWDQATNTWTSRADSPSATLYGIAFSIGTKGYFGLGSSLSDFYEWDQASDTWTQRAEYPGEAIHRAVGFSMSGKGYVGTGVTSGGICVTDFYEWDPALNVWTQMANFGGTGRECGIGFSIGDKGYIGMGINSPSFLKDFWEFSTSNIVPTAWTQKTNYPGYARSGSVGFSIGTKGYIGTGYGNTSYLADFWEWDQATNIWTQKADFGGGNRAYAVGFSIGTKGYIGTGANGATQKQDFWEWNPTTNTWTQKTNFPGTARRLAAGFSIGTKGYIGTGLDAGSVLKKDFWEYNPASNTWQQKADFSGSARSAAIGLSIGPNGFIGTGSSLSGKPLKDFWEYVPVLDLWLQKASLPAIGRFGAVGFSVGNKGYIGSGYSDSTNTYLNDFFEYNSSTDKWDTIAPMTGGPRRYAVGFSIGSNIYIGTGAGSADKKDFWKYCSSPPITIVTDSILNVKCNGTNSGSIYISSSGGVGSYTYLWSNGLTTQDATSIPAGIFYVNVFDVAGCSNEKKITVTEPPALAAIAPLTAEACVGCDGIAGLINVSGGTPPYAYTWNSSSQTTTSASALCPGKNTVCVNDAKGCMVYDTININVFQDAWVVKTTFPGGGREFAVGFSIGNYGYIGTGYNSSSYLSDFLQYDPFTNSWTGKANAGTTARRLAVGFSIGNKGYIGTGENQNGALKDFWEYDPSTDTWTQKADFGGTARASAIGFGIGNKGYICTGINGITRFNDLWEYDPPNNTWMQKANLPGSDRSGAVGFNIGSKGYICTGTNDAAALNDLWEYDPSSDTWFQKANFPGAGRSYAIGFAIDGYGYVGATGTSDFWMYDPSNNSWQQKANAIISPSHAVSFTISHWGYVGLGIWGGAYPNFLKYGNCLAPLSITDNVSNVLCYGGNNGSAVVIVTGGNMPYTYSWSSGQTTSAISNLTAGNYTAVVKDAINAIATKIVSITQPLAISATFTVTNSSSCVASDGKIIAKISGGTNPYSYIWSTGSSSATITGLAHGTYTLTVTDSNSCTKIINAIVNCPTGITQSPSQLDLIVCPNPANGFFTLQMPASDYNIEIYNLFGEKVFEKRGKALNTYGINLPFEEISIDLSGQPSGVYFINVKTDAGSFLKKIIVQK